MFNYLYNLFIDDVTHLCYGSCLRYFPTHSTILDVGIGNGTMIEQYHSVIKEKKLNIIGIDINRHYLRHCRKLIHRYGLENLITVYCEAIETYNPPRKEFFDFIFFSMSFMLFPNQQLVLDRIKPWLKPDGSVIFFQTMFKNRSLLLEVIKPRLKYLTTIDFGKVTYEKDFFDLLTKTELRVKEDKILRREWFKGEYRLIVSEPLNGFRNSENGVLDAASLKTAPAYPPEQNVTLPFHE